MTAQLLDHLFVIVVVGLVFPLGGWWTYRAFLARVAAQGDAALVPEYRLTLLWLAGLVVATLGIWLAADRGLADLGFVPLRITAQNDWVIAVSLGGAISLVVRPLLALAVPRVASALAAQMAKLADFLPKTNRQLIWALLVSLAAGVCEEIAYRGYLQPYFESMLSRYYALAAASVLFGLAHIYQGWSGVLLTTLLGAAFGAIYIATGSLLLPILLHCAIDVSTMVTARVVLGRNAIPSKQR